MFKGASFDHSLMFLTYSSEGWWWEIKGKSGQEGSCVPYSLRSRTLLCNWGEPPKFLSRGMDKQGDKFMPLVPFPGSFPYL